jgi:hypothetical protein
MDEHFSGSTLGFNKPRYVCRSCGAIENVRVAEINQGNNPFRILSLRALPDGHVKELKGGIHQQNQKNKDLQELAADEEGGDYYNLECSFV